VHCSVADSGDIHRNALFFFFGRMMIGLRSCSYRCLRLYLWI
jgi:hypothetical protein